MTHYTTLLSRRFLPIISLLLITLTSFASPVHAANYNVGCNAGVGDTAQLMASINAANGDAAADTINLAANCVYTLAAHLPTITTSMTINGGSGTIIDGANTYRPFTITDGIVFINDMTIRHGFTEMPSRGSAIQMVSVSFTANLTVNRVSFYQNGPSTAVWNSGGTLTILNSSFDGNGWFVPPSGSVHENAIGVQVGFLSLINSTVTNHTSLRGVAILTATNDSVLISNSTIAGNNAGYIAQGGTVSIRNSILANNPADDCQGLGAAMAVNNSVVMKQGTLLHCGVTNGVNGNITADPKLKPLTGNPAYLPITAESPAFNAGDNGSVYPGLTVDQAGNSRIRDGIVDMGAYEALAPAVVLNAASTTVPEGSASTLTLTRYDSTLSISQTVSLTLTRGTNMTAGDYTISGGSISGQDGNVTATIPAGVVSVDLTFTANNDGSSAEPDNTLTVALVSGAGYELGSLTTATVTIPANGTDVSSLSDNATDEGTLRQAILNANSDPANDTITFTIGGTINLTSPLPDVVANGRIIVQGGDAITINGGSNHRAFNVLTGADLRLRDLTIRQAFAPTSGGALRTAGTLQLIGVTVQNSDTFGDGGAIRSDGGASLTLINSTLTGNIAVNGGGISNAGTAFVVNSTIAGNSGLVSGAGLDNDGTLTLQNSIVADNLTTANCSGTITVQNSLIEDGTCGVINGVGGNKTGDPVLGALSGSPAYFPLLMTSPAINAGSNALIIGGITTDQPGNARVIDTTVDMGAFESTPASLNLTLALQGRPTAPNPSYVTNVQIQVRPAGSTTPLTTLNLVSDTNGLVSIPGMTAWSYDIWVKGSHTLARSANFVLAGGSNAMTTAMLREGDANNDNVIILVDFSLLAGSFGTAVGNPSYNAQADFNNDGVINLIDFSLLASNFNQAGAP